MSDQLATMVRTASDSGENYILDLPEEDSDAWKGLLYLIITNEVPAEDALVLTKCRVLGETYSISDFQDSIMVRLLACVEKYGTPTAAIEYGLRNSQQQSEVGQLMMAELVMNIYYHKQDVDAIFLDDFDHEPGILKASVKATLRHQEDANVYIDRFKSSDREGRRKWRKFLVGNGRKLGWLPSDYLLEGAM